MLSNKALWVLRQMVKNPSEIELVEFFPYRTGLVNIPYNKETGEDEDTGVIVDYSGSKNYYGGREPASIRFASLINRMESILLGDKRDNHVCATVRFRGRVHAMRFSDWGCTLVLDRAAEKFPRSH